MKEMNVSLGYDLHFEVFYFPSLVIQGAWVTGLDWTQDFLGALSGILTLRI